jgi:hypothetical protein
LDTFDKCWISTSFTWDGSAKEDIQLMSAEEIYNKLREIGGDNFNHVTGLIVKSSICVIHGWNLLP